MLPLVVPAPWIHAEVGQPTVAVREDAVLPPPDFGMDDDASMDSVFFHGYKAPGSRTRRWWTGEL